MSGEERSSELAETKCDQETMFLQSCKPEFCGSKQNEFFDSQSNGQERETIF